MIAVKRSKEIGAEREAKRNVAGLAGISLIVYLFDKLSDVIYNALINGFFGYIFTVYDSELDAYKNGYIVSYFKGGSKTRKFLRAVREYLSRNFETSFILKKIRRSVLKLAFVPLKTYGSFFLSFGIYTLLVYFINTLLPITGTSDIDYLYVGVGICVIALPMYFSALSLADAVRKGRITSAIFVDAFGYRDEAFENTNAKKRNRSGVAVLFGIVAGILTFVIHPMMILGSLLISLITVLIMITPEIGVLMSLFGLPFFSLAENPAFLLATLVLLTTFSYVIKLIRGKRIFKLELIDLAVMLFLAIILFSGAITVGGRNSYYSALISCSLMCGYFLVVNLIRTQKWLHRCVLALVSSGTVVAVIGVLQYILGASVKQWLDTSYFSDIEGRTTSLFENPNYLGAYLALIFPFVLYQTIVGRSKKERLLGFISCIMFVICAVFTWSRGAWLAIIISSLIFFVIFTRKTMRVIFGALLSLPFLPFVLPSNVVTRFMSIGDMADSSTMYRVYTWRGSIEMVKEYFWGGIGYGTEAFAQLYPVYAYAGIESAVHSHSLYLQILIGMGIGGLACFAFLIVLYVQKSLEYLKVPSSRDSFLITAAAMVSFLALLIMGVFDYVWYNYRIFFLFWTVIAIGVACIRIGKKELSRLVVSKEMDDYFGAIDVEV